MYITFFAIIIAVLVTANQLFKFYKYKKFLKKYSEDNKVNVLVTKRSTGSYIQQLAPIAFCAVLALYIFLVPGSVDDPQTSIGMIIILCILFTSTIATGSMYLCIYYTENGFFLGNKFIKFFSVKEVKNPKRKASEVILGNGESIKIGPRQIDALKEIYASQKINLNVSI